MPAKIRFPEGVHSPCEQSKKKPKQISAYTAQPKGNKSNVRSRSERGPVTCILCVGNHFTNQCESFNKLTTNKPVEFCKANKRCINCLRKDHSVSDCISKGWCSVCQGRHHTKRHTDNRAHGVNKPTTPTQSPATGSTSVYHTYSPKLLATAQVILKSRSKQEMAVRAFIDLAAEVSFISEYAVRAREVKGRSITVQVSGVGSEVTAASSNEVKLIVHSRVDKSLHLSLTR